MADQPQQCTGADDPRERCGRHHPLAVLDGGTCCCDAPWLPAKDQCFSGAGEGDRVSLGIKLEAMLGYTVADAPQGIAAHVEGVMDILAQHATVAGDYRQRITDALTATCPRHSLFDGNCPRCDERLAAVLAVRDQDAETLRSDNEELRKRAEAAEAEVTRLRAGEASEPAPDGTWSTPPQWIRHWNTMPANVRLAMADQILRNAQAAHDCAMAHGLRAQFDRKDTGRG